MRLYDIGNDQNLGCFARGVPSTTSSPKSQRGGRAMPSPSAHNFSGGVAFVGGEYVPVEEARIPLLDWGFLRSDANQDTVSVWKGLVFRFDDHLARFKRNIERLRMVVPYDHETRRSIVLEC